MTERFSFAVDRHLDGSVVWSQDNMENSALGDTMNEGYVTAEEDSPTRYLSVLDTTSDMSLENLNITLANPKLEVEDVVEYGNEDAQVQGEEGDDQVVVFSVDGSDELYGVQVVQDEQGNLQKFQFQFRKNEQGHLEAIPETIAMISMEEETPLEPEEYETHQTPQDSSLQIYVQEDNSSEHILPGEPPEEMEDESTVTYDDPEEQLDIKPGILQLQSVKQEPEYDPPELAEPEAFPQEFEEEQTQEETSVDYQEAEPEAPDPPVVEDQEYEHVEVRPDMTAIPDGSDNANDSDETDYHIVEGLHITGDVDSEAEEVEKPQTNILKHALKTNKDSSKLVKKDNKLYLYVVQDPEKENVDSLSMEMSNLCRSKVNPRSILKSSHAMFQAKNEIEEGAEDRMTKRFARCKEAVQAMLFHNFINKTTIPQAPVRKNRLPRKQKIKPVERMDEEIVVQEVMVSSNGFVEAVGGGVNKENLAVTEYVELTDSDDDYDPKKITRKKKKHRRKKVEITISDESDSHDSVIELVESDDEEPGGTNNNNTTPPKRRRGRPPKNKSVETPSKKQKVEVEVPEKPEIPCPKCDKTFPSHNSLKTHLQHHNLQSSIKRALPEYKYKCENCASTFINSILLKKHMCSKLFNCTVCKKKFTDLTTLSVHKRTHAKEQMVKSTTVARVSPKKIKQPQATFKVPKLNKCKVCGKLCSSLQNLTTHLKTHKEFNCATCGKNFISKLVFEKHVRESCVKSPQNRRSPRHEKNRRASSAVPAITAKCEQCSQTFSGYQALFRHKVQEHGLDTPDKSAAAAQQVVKLAGSGVPATRRLHLNCSKMFSQLDFDD